ncbi:Parp12 [Symbiodinium pilosum]|uniref:Parp12 protein n=1 Tax=Symbiodinium pilosum TaxID=2952 RepID=A0A812KH05_SYMPI|nr:Parp12 [Symbiodinium pilosum]
MFLMQRARAKSAHGIQKLSALASVPGQACSMRKDRTFFAEPGLEPDGQEGLMTMSQPVFNCGEPLAADVHKKILLHGNSSENADAIAASGDAYSASETWEVAHRPPNCMGPAGTHGSVVVNPFSSC